MDEHELREYIKNLLIDKTDAEDRVYNMRGMNLQEEELPAINVVTPSDSITDSHVLTIRIEIHAFCAFDEDILGQRVTEIKKQIRAALFRFYQNVGTFDSRHIGSELRLNTTAERPHAVLRVIYEADFEDTE